MSEATNGAALMEPPSEAEVQQTETALSEPSEKGAVEAHALPPGPQPDIEDVVKASKAAAKKQQPKKTPEEIFLAELCDLEEKAQAAKGEYLEAKQEAAELKKQWDALAQKIIDKLKAWSRPVPLFDRKPETSEGAAKTPDGPTAGDLSKDESWRQVPIEDLRMPHKDDPTKEGKPLPPTILQKLYDADLTTLGMLADWTMQKTLTDIPGVGEGSAEKISLATEVYWAKRKAQMDAPVTLVEEPAKDEEKMAEQPVRSAPEPYCVNCGRRFPLCESDSRWKVGYLFPLSMERFVVRKKFPIKEQSGHICGACHFDFIDKEWKNEKDGSDE